MMKPASAPRRNPVREATSSAVPTRPAGDASISARNARRALAESSSFWASGVMITPGLIEFARAPRSPHSTLPPGPGGCSHASRIRRTDRVGDVPRRQERQLQQLVSGSGRECLFLGWLQLRLSVAGHARDHDRCTAGGDHSAELFEHEGRAEQIDLEDGVGGRHRRREPGGLDDWATLPSASAASARDRTDSRPDTSTSWVVTL